MTQGSGNANQHQRNQGLGPDRTEERIALTPGARIELVAHNVNGDIRVRTTDRDDVLIRSHKTGRRDSRRYDESYLTVEARDNHIEVRPHLAATVGWSGAGIGKLFGRSGERVDEVLDDVLGRFGSGNGGVEYDVDVELPRDWQAGASVQARNVSGAVSVADVAGPVNVATASGDVQARGIDGDLTIHTASGDTLIDHLHGSLTARSASGDVRISAAVLQRFGLTTVSGDINFDGTLTGASYRAQTVSGDARLDLQLPLAAGDGEPNATVTFQTVSGDADVDPPFRKVERRAWRVGSGDGASIAVKTVSGDLTVAMAVAHDVPAHPGRDALATAPAPVEPPAPPTPPEPAASEPPVLPDAPTQPMPDSAEPVETQPQESHPADEADRLAVLQALEHGEIDIEEALNRLEAMGEEPSL